jgi:hypothetical protein
VCYGAGGEQDTLLYVVVLSLLSWMVMECCLRMQIGMRIVKVVKDYRLRNCFSVLREL